MTAQKPTSSSSDEFLPVVPPKHQPPAAEPTVDTEILLVTVSEAARMLSTGRNTIYEMLKTDSLPHVVLGSTRGYRIPVEALRQWIADEAEKS